jgi:hypothetical protein
MNADPIKPRVLRRSGGRVAHGLKPIVLEYQPRKKKSSDDDEAEEQYSDGFEDIQRVEGDLVRIARRATTAAAKGLDTYDRERRRSAREKEDGAIKDFPHNAAQAASDALKEASEIPVDIADSMQRTNVYRRLRRNLRRVSKAIAVFRL